MKTPLVNKKNVLLILFLLHVQSMHALWISLGRACPSALNLRKLHMRSDAYPFDWVVSPFDSLLTALQTDFQYFLSDLRLRDDRQGVIDYYGISYIHDWPTVNQPHVDALNTDFISNNPISPQWQNALPFVKEKYRRRIERFRAACMGNEKVFFVRSEEITKEQAITLRDFFNAKYPALDFVLVVLKSDASFVSPWNIDKIKNFYIVSLNHTDSWATAFGQVFPDEVHMRYAYDFENSNEHTCCSHQAY
ncbi:MAG: DUF1796 family putative cysteine peptidase [Candidatus Babeliales bacterium]|nr:DUF1796 family putative cysteine peptidase [Candidatus Babeliales bacterium]